MAAAAVVTAGGQIYGGMAQSAQAKYEAAVNNQNAKMEDRAKVDAISRGETEQMQNYRRLSQALGAARLRNAAAGLDTGFGSAANLETDTAMIGYEDSAAIAENTNKEVMGYDINAANDRSAAGAALARGKAAKTGAFIGAAGTLLSSASQIAGSGKARGQSWASGF